MQVKHVVERALAFYRREGLRPLVHEAVDTVRDSIPIEYRLVYRKFKLHQKYGEAAVADPLRVLWINPDAISYSGPRFSRTKHIGTVLSGEWDKNCSPFEESTIYQGLRERFEDGMDWKETQYYEKAVWKIENDGYYLGYETINEFERYRLPYLDELYAAIEENGYKRQTELTEDDQDDVRHRFMTAQSARTHEIGCNIGRSGELLFNSGKHRLSIAKLLEIDEIPVQIIVRHRKWQETRRELANTQSIEDLGNDFDTDHPDLSDVI